MSLDNIRFTRQLDIVDADKLPSVCIIGYGGIGSTLSIFLSKMGAKRFTIYDHDDVQLHNIANQMFPKDSVGKLKVEVARAEIRRYSPRRDIDLSIEVFPEMFTEDSSIHGSDIVISALDSIAVRRVVWKALKWEMPKLYIDARMGGETAKVYAVDPLDGNQVRFYEASLEQEEFTIPCTAQSISYNVGMIAAMVCSIVKRHTNGDKIPRLVIGDSHNLTFTSIWGVI